MSFAIVLFTPITVAVRRAKAGIFTRPSILFRPHDPGGAAGYRPRVRSVYYMCVYRHSSVRNTPHLVDPVVNEKGQKEKWPNKAYKSDSSSRADVSRNNFLSWPLRLRVGHVSILRESCSTWNAPTLFVDPAGTTVIERPERDRPPGDPEELLFPDSSRPSTNSCSFPGIWWVRNG